MPFRGSIEGFVVNYVARNEWRVASTHERGDLMSEAWLVYAKIADRYPGVEAPHFMALFKTAWTRHFTGLANKNSADRAALVRPQERFDEDGDAYGASEPVGDTDNHGTVLTMIRQAPREVALVLQLFLSAPQELLEVALATWHGPRESQSDGGSLRINQLLGLDPAYDSVGAVRSYFAECRV